jgi:hypothetical protein
MRIYIQNQRAKETKEKNVGRLHMSTYFKSLDADNFIGHVQSSHLHHIYDMVELCLTTRMDESICFVCDNLVPMSSFT